MRKIEMVDLKQQYSRLKPQIDSSIQECLDNSIFIKGSQVTSFQKNLESYLNVSHVIPCANGTDALQIAMMALGLKVGDEVIVPNFTYVATAEVIGLLGLIPVLVDVNHDNFNINTECIEKAITDKTRLIVPVHLFGQCADMETIMKIANKHNLFVIEDTAQAIGSKYTFADGTVKMAGTIGDIGTTSFFPSKNLGCYGDGGAIVTDNEELAIKLRMIANHGQAKQYYHEVIGVNSRLDSIQAAILNVKLPYLDAFNEARQNMACSYDNAFKSFTELTIPHREVNSTHVFHQYTIKIKDGRRDDFKQYLSDKSIPSMIYYPLPLHHQKAYQSICKFVGELNVSEKLCSEVISLPIHTECEDEQLHYIIQHITDYFN
jgi:UDP-2-acetamido-2-deoxy-ribo-hexuluronate aminotransferase